MNDQKTTETPLTDAAIMICTAVGVYAPSEGMQDLPHDEMVPVTVCRSIELKLTAAQSRLEASRLREAELAKALEDLRGATEHYWPTDVPSSIRLTKAEWAADVALQSPASQNNPKETKA